MRLRVYDPATDGYVYPFQKHKRFGFWASNMQHRKRTMSQAQFYIDKCDQAATKTWAELEDVIDDEVERERLINSMSSYTANVTGSILTGTHAKRS